MKAEPIIEVGSMNYLNDAGPADYNLKGLTGSPVIDSRKANSPGFSIGERHAKSPYISKHHTQEYLGKDTPGAGAYYPILDTKTH